MSRETRILTTHVGSLVRPPDLVEFLKLTEENRPYDRDAYEACLTASVAEVVRQQADAEVDVVSDGEFGKSGSWSWYIQKRIAGVTQRPATAEEIKDPLLALGPGATWLRFPNFTPNTFRFRT